MSKCVAVTWDLIRKLVIFFNSWIEQTLTSISTELYPKAKGRSVTSGDFLKSVTNVSDCYDNVNNLNKR